MLIVVGSPVGSADGRRYTRIKRKKKAIAQAIESGVRVLGVCLGAQLIANVLGARVYPNREKEIGWWPIELDPPNVRDHPLGVLPQRSMMFHWHGDTFDLPRGARHLARSQACENQAFAFESHVVGLQFHMETAASHIEALTRHAGDDLQRGAFVQTAEEMLREAGGKTPPMHAALFRFLDRFTDGIEG